MTNLEKALEEIEARLAAATQGRWYEMDDEIVGPKIPNIPRGFREYDTVAMADDPHDRMLIAHAPQDIAVLMRMVRLLSIELNHIMMTRQDMLDEDDGNVGLLWEKAKELTK